METDNPLLSPSLKRLRWKSRRGWLELDLLLSAFWRCHGNDLTAAEIALLDKWLEFDDEQLWALFKTPPVNGSSLEKKIHAGSIFAGAFAPTHGKLHS